MEYPQKDYYLWKIVVCYHVAIDLRNVYQKTAAFFSKMIEIRDKATYD